MATILIFKIKDLKGFENDPLIKKASKKLKNNYMFKHIIKGEYLFTPDLSKIIHPDLDGITLSKSYVLLLYILSLYKYAVMKGYLELYQISNQSTDPIYNETLKSLVKYILNKEDKFPVTINLGYRHMVKGHTSVVIEYYVPIKRNIIYRKSVIVIHIHSFIDDEYDESKPPVMYLLEAPLSRYRAFFFLEDLPEFYTIKNNKVVKLFECPNSTVEYLKIILGEPPILPLLKHYIKTGEIINVKGYTPQEQLIRNFYAVVTGTKTHNPNDYYLTSNHMPRMTKYYTETVSKDNSLTLNEEKIKKYYELFKNIVTLNIGMANKLYYNYKITGLKQYFNPPANVIKQILEQTIRNNLYYKKLSSPKVELIWRNVKTKKGEYPYFIIIKASAKVQRITGDTAINSYYCGVYNNIEDKLEIHTKYFTINTLHKVKESIIYHTQITHTKKREVASINLTIV